MFTVYITAPELETHSDLIPEWPLEVRECGSAPSLSSITRQPFGHRVLTSTPFADFSDLIPTVPHSSCDAAGYPNHHNFTTRWEPGRPVSADLARYQHRTKENAPGVGSKGVESVCLGLPGVAAPNKPLQRLEVMIN